MTKRLVLVALGMGALAACAGDRDDPPSPSGQGPSGPVVSGSTPTAAPSSPPATGRVAHTDAIARAPTFLWADAPARPRIAAGVASPAEAARAHVVSFARYYRLAPEQAGALDLRELHDTGRGAIIARFGRRVDGVEVFGEQLSVAMDRNLDAVALTGFVTGDLPAAAKQPGRRARDAFASGSAAAITAAMSDLAGAAIAASDFEAAAPAAGGYQAARLRPAAATRVAAAADAAPTRAKPIFFRIAPDSLVPAYYVEADLGDDAAHRARHVAYVIDAGDGRVLWRNDLTAYDNPVTYRAYADASGLFTPWDGPHGTAVTPHPTGLADGFQPLFVPAQLVTLSSLTAVGVDDPWLPVGATETLGNNVDAYLDLAAPDGFLAGTADLRGVASAPGVFDYTFDTELGADENAVQRLAAVTQLFYDNNWFHDWYYAAGFTEAAGNAQLSNFGRGGVEGDVLRAEAQDSGGFNNANMSTPADGGRPRMQMYLWTKPIELRVTVAAPPELAGDFTSVGTAVFGPLNFELSADIARASPVDACAPLVGDYAGKIVLVDRGGPAACNGFAGKAQQVQAAGGAGVIIANVAASANPTIPPAMGGTPTVPITIRGRLAQPGRRRPFPRRARCRPGGDRTAGAAREAARRRHRQPGRRPRVGPLHLQPPHLRRGRPAEQHGARTRRGLGRLPRPARHGARGGHRQSSQRQLAGDVRDGRVRDQQRPELVLLRHPPLSVLDGHDEEPDDVQAHLRRQSAPRQPAAKLHRRQLAGARHRHRVGHDAVGVLRGPPARHGRPRPAADLRPGARPHARLRRRRLQGDARQPDPARGARRASAHRPAGRPGRLPGVRGGVREARRRRQRHRAAARREHEHAGRGELRVRPGRATDRRAPARRRHRGVRR